MKATTLCSLLLLSSLLLLLLLPREAAAAVNCAVVAAKAAPCLSFATGKVPRPPAACCAGLQQLAHQAVTVADRRTTCHCLENGVKRFPGVQDRFLSKIPAACNIRVGFPVSRNTNCDRIK
ncbi:non-specific lipid-transfer protein C, cotyledon-specific isoform-like [Phoenix dactylifera]|uniref:Non-specific lipid-transfer protein n=1 Tax=Phoenix dactylifera TaxID=42345 RepID=A0A8B8ZPI3_PHODC|nr:non-specific lipid-transfer protein C, cotyledon-specific isoform-like [Phoenix dactylifera]